jgi:hypothetical protein
MNLRTQYFEKNITAIHQDGYFSLIDKNNNVSYCIDGTLYSFKDENGIYWKSAYDVSMYESIFYDHVLKCDVAFKDGIRYIFTTPKKIKDRANIYFSEFIKRNYLSLQCASHFFVYDDLAWREAVLTFRHSQIDYDISYN